MQSDLPVSVNTKRKKGPWDRTHKSTEQIRQSVTCLLDNVHLVSQSIWSNLREICILCRPAHLVEGAEDLHFHVSIQAVMSKSDIGRYRSCMRLCVKSERRTKIIATDVLARPLFEKSLGSLTEVQEVNVRSAQNLEAKGKSVSKCLRRINSFSEERV